MFWYGVIVGVVGSWLVRRVFMGYNPAPKDLKVLGRKSYGIICAIGEALLPEGGDIPLSYLDAGVPHFVDRYMQGVPKLNARLMMALYFLMEHATYIFAFTTRRMSELPLDKRIAYLDGWEKSRLYPRRLAFISLRAIFGMAYLACPDVEKAMGYRITDECRQALIVERPQH